MKLRLPVLLSALIGTTSAAGARSLARISYAGRRVSTSAPVVQYPSGTLVPLRAVTQALGGRIEWNQSTRTVVVRHEGQRLEVNPRANTLSLDGKPLKGLISPRTIGGQLLVPLAGLERLFAVCGRWLPKQHMLSFAVTSGGNGQAGRRDAGETEQAAPDNPPAASGLRLRLTSDKKSYAIGKPIVLTLAVTNLARAPATIQFSSGQKYEFEVRRAGQTVWRWSADRMFTQALTSLTLGPGERRLFTETWKQQDNNGQPVPAGAYEAVAILTTMGQARPKSAPLAFRIGG
jgi:hypothetical protein